MANFGKGNSRLVWGALVVGVVSMAACGGDGSSRPATGTAGTTGMGGAAGMASGTAGATGGTGATATAGATGSAGSTGTAGATAAAGSTGTAGAAGTAGATAVVSNLAGVPINVSKTADAASIVLVSFNLVPDPTSTINYVEWFGEVKNTGATPACFVKLELDFQSGAGVSVLMLEGYADADPYKIGTLDLPSGCIPAGHTAGVWSNDLPSAPVNTSSITQVNISLSLLSSPGAVPHPDAPTMSGLAVAPDTQFGAGNWLLNGTVTAVTTIYNISVTAYFRGASGLLVAHGTDTHLDTLAAGMPWSIGASAAFTTTPTGFLATNDFLPGAKGSLSIEAPLTDLQLRVRDEVFASRSLRQRLQARADVRTLGARPIAPLAR